MCLLESVAHLCPTRRLHVPTLDETTLAKTTPGFGSTHGLKVTVLDKAALPAAVTVGCAAVGTAIRVLDEAVITP